MKNLGLLLGVGQKVCTKLDGNQVRRPVYQLIMTSQNTHSKPIMHWDTCMADGRASPAWCLGWQGPKGGTGVEFLMSYAQTKPEHLDLPCVQQAEPKPSSQDTHISHSHISFSQLWPNYRVLSNMNYALACMCVCVCVCSAQLIFKPITDFD